VHPPFSALAFSPLSQLELAQLGERIAAMRAETAEIVADTREAVRRSHDLIVRMKSVRADGPWAARPCPTPLAE